MSLKEESHATTSKLLNSDKNEGEGLTKKKASLNYCGYERRTGGESTSKRTASASRVDCSKVRVASQRKGRQDQLRGDGRLSEG